MKIQSLVDQGKPHNIYAEVLEQEALDQFESAMQTYFAVSGALMADAHAGYSLPIGGVVATKDKIVPAWIGFDIGCGMCALPTTFNVDLVRKNATRIFIDIYKEIPVGFSHNGKKQTWEAASSLDCTDRFRTMFNDDGLYQLGSLGGGNHFIEIGVDETNKVWIIIHSGSRGIGHRTATYYMREASGDGKAREGHYPLDVDSEDGRNYIRDMNFCLAFALENRKQMIRRVEDVMRVICQGAGDWDNLINRNHNHAEPRDGLWIHRKGATHAEAGMMGVIPGNMRDGSFIVKGKGNPESLWSSSHGAGRVLGRKEAQRTLKMEEFQETMKGVQARISEETLDESPFAYKSIFDVMNNQKDLVETIARVTPIINIKG